MNEIHATSSMLVVSPNHPSIPSPQHLPVPAPRSGPIATRVATMADLPWMDALQKQFGRALGYFPTKQFEGYIEMGAVLVAEGDGLPIAECRLPNDSDSNRKSQIGNRQSLGYVISRDRYLKRDELGVIYQLCVAPGHQRGLIGATLVREVFQRSAYGCRLYCCWCAQDLPANRFWESMGFVPIAFRAGSAKKKRVHIFWQRRIDAELPIDDCQLPNELKSNRKSQIGNRQSPTPYWYPCNTNAGAMAEDRLVFPIPPGTHWSEVQAVAIPSDRGLGILPEPKEAAPRKRADRRSSGETPKPREDKPTISAGGLFFGVPKPVPTGKAKKERVAKPRTQRVKVKADPALVAKARELRDRYLERANDRMLIAPSGKYDVSRALSAAAAAPAPARVASASFSAPAHLALPAA